MIRGKTDNKPFTIHPQETRPSDVRSDALLGCPFCGEAGVEIKDMSELNAGQSGKPVNPFGCKNCRLFVSTREDWNTRHSNVSTCGYCGHDHDDDDCAYSHEPEHADYMKNKPNDLSEGSDDRKG